MAVSLIDMFSLDPKCFRSIEHESFSAEVVYVEDRRFGPVVIKRHRQMEHFEQECYALEHFDQVFSTPKLMAKGDQAILMEWLPGAPLDIKCIGDRENYAMGELTARLHEMPVEDAGTILDIEANFEKHCVECARYEALVEKARRHFDDHKEALRELGNACWLHRDIRPGNFLAEGEITGWLDWEYLSIGPAAYDLAHMELHVWREHPQHRQAFMEGYVSVRPWPECQNIMPVLKLSKMMGILGFAIQNGHPVLEKHWLSVLKRLS